VRWVNLHRRSGSCINPAAEDTTAGEHNGMGSFGVDHGHFQVAIKGCGFDVQPIHADKIQHPSGSGFDKDQVPALVAPNNFRKVKLHETISPESHCPKWKKLSSASSAQGLSCLW
jgi:hypothetical protein